MNRKKCKQRLCNGLQWITMDHNNPMKWIISCNDHFIVALKTFDKNYNNPNIS